jgi:hypothetical protein
LETQNEQASEGYRVREFGESQAMNGQRLFLLPEPAQAAKKYGSVSQRRESRQIPQTPGNNQEKYG